MPLSVLEIIELCSKSPERQAVKVFYMLRELKGGEVRFVMELSQNCDETITKQEDS